MAKTLFKVYLESGTVVDLIFEGMDRAEEWFLLSEGLLSLLENGFELILGVLVT